MMDKSKDMSFKKNIDSSFEDRKKVFKNQSITNRFIDSSIASRLVPMGHDQEAKEQYEEREKKIKGEK